MAVQVLFLLLVVLVGACDPPGPPPEPDAAAASAQDLELPSVRGGEAPEPAVHLTETLEAISVDGVKLLALEAAQDGPPAPTPDLMKGQLIVPLYDRLLEKAEKAKMLAERSPETTFEGRLLLSMDQHLPFSLVRSVLYTAGQAQFGLLLFEVRDPDSGQLAVLESNLPEIGPCLSETAPPGRCPEPQALVLVVLITDSGLALSGADTVLGCSHEDEACRLPCRPAGCPTASAYDLAALQTMLARVKKEQPDQESVIILAESGIRYGLLAAVMGAAMIDGSTQNLFWDVVIAGGAE